MLLEANRDYVASVFDVEDFRIDSSIVFEKIMYRLYNICERNPNPGKESLLVMLHSYVQNEIAHSSIAALAVSRLV